MSYNSSRYSFSNASMVLNEEGIPVHKEDYVKPHKRDKHNDKKLEAKKELAQLAK